MDDPARTIACEACGESFGCGAGTDRCWCNAVSVPLAALKELRAHHGDCVCPSCLRAAASASAAPGAEAAG